MQHDIRNISLAEEELAELGTDAVAYVKRVAAQDVTDLLPDDHDIDLKQKFWALFAANGEPLVISNHHEEIMSSAFYNDLKAVLPN